jgi:hypothetical protein
LIAAPTNPMTAPPPKATTPSWKVSQAPCQERIKLSQTTPYWNV